MTLLAKNSQVHRFSFVMIWIFTFLNLILLYIICWLTSLFTGSSFATEGLSRLTRSFCKCVTQPKASLCDGLRCTTWSCLRGPLPALIGWVLDQSGADPVLSSNGLQLGQRKSQSLWVLKLRNDRLSFIPCRRKKRRKSQPGKRKREWRKCTTSSSWSPEIRLSFCFWLQNHYESSSWTRWFLQLI